MELIIQRTNTWFHIPWRDLLHYRDLLFLLVRRDFVANYKQTILGPAWFIIQPLFTTLVFTVIFGKVARIPTDSIPPMLFYLCGMLAWGYFAQCMNGASATFVKNAGLFGKVYFPRLVVPLSIVISSMLAFAIQLAMFLCFWVYFNFLTPAGGLIRVTPYLLLVPLMFLQTAVLGLGVGLLLSAMTAKYRDMMHAMGFLAQLWMYATPVVYPLSVAPEEWRWVLALNPMASVVEVYRLGFLGQGTITGLQIALSAATAALIALAGLVFFTRTERTFVDTV